MLIFAQYIASNHEKAKRDKTQPAASRCSAEQRGEGRFWISFKTRRLLHPLRCDMQKGCGKLYSAVELAQRFCG